MLNDKNSECRLHEQMRFEFAYELHLSSDVAAPSLIVHKDTVKSMLRSEFQR